MFVNSGEIEKRFEMSEAEGGKKKGNLETTGQGE
jgi:hypothetical protein